MDTIRNSLSQFFEIAPNIAFALLIWGVVDNYFLARYDGKLNRGFTIWKTPIKNDEQQFLLTLKEDIVERKKIGPWRTKTSFIMVKDGEALIRYSNPSQNTSWPLVGYVDIFSPNVMLEYRLSLPMLVGTVFLSSIQIFIVAFLSVAFGISWLFEAGGIRNYLSQKVDLYFVRQLTQKQKGFS
jgi:hypothetical protein